MIALAVRQRAVVVYMIVATRDGKDAFVDEGLLEARIEARRGRCFGVFPAGFDNVGRVAVFREGDVYERHIHVHMAIPVVARAALEILARGAEPVDLALFQPVVASEMAFVGAVGVGVEEVEGQRGVRGGFVCEDFEVVVSYAVDGGGAGDRDVVEEGFG